MRTRTETAWKNMLQRCYRPKNVNFYLYGGRGITVCERWLNFNNFLQDMGEAPNGLTLDRIDNNGNYEPGNCRWIPQRQNSRNMRSNRLFTIDGVTRTQVEWCELHGIHQNTFAWRLRRGYSPEQALTSSVMPHRRLLTYQGETHSTIEWSRRTGIPRTVLRRRIDKGWPVEKALAR